MSSLNNENKTVVITGASSGIGLTLSKTYLERGFNVVANARTLGRLQDALGPHQSTQRLLLLEGDIGEAETSKKIFSQAVSRFGKVDVLVNNAGIFLAKPFTDYTGKEMDDLIKTNLKGFVYASQQAALHMIPRKSGHIISITASIADQPLQNVPAALPILIKGGINQATRALALELAPHNIQVSAVAPGIVDTPLYPKEMHAFLNTLQPAGRIGTTQEIAEAVFYLSEAAFTTGVVLNVDGGMSSGKW